jgi:hypothetical protein
MAATNSRNFSIKIFIALLFLIPVRSFCQDMVLHDPVSSRTFNSEKYSGFNGSPFLFDKWINGWINTTNGIYKDLSLKLDIYSNIIYFKKDDESYEIQDPVVTFTLMSKVGDSASYLKFRKGLSGSIIKPEQYVQILAEGPVSLYRSDIKLLTDVNEINNGVVKTFTGSSRYIVVKDGSMQLLKNPKKDILPFLQDKNEKVQEFISINKLSLNKDLDLKSLINYYNSLR